MLLLGEWKIHVPVLELYSYLQFLLASNLICNSAITVIKLT
jgi:hypothetical protein